MDSGIIAEKYEWLALFCVFFFLSVQKIALPLVAFETFRRLTRESCQVPLCAEHPTNAGHICNVTNISETETSIIHTFQAKKAD